MAATDSPRTDAIRGELAQPEKKTRKILPKSSVFGTEQRGGCPNTTTTADIGTPGEKRRDIGRRHVGRAIELALFQSPLWTSADNNAGSVPNAEFAEKDGNRQFWPACEEPGAQILSSLESTDVILGCKACKTGLTKSGPYLMRPMRSALATACVRLTVSSFFVARFK